MALRSVAKFAFGDDYAEMQRPSFKFVRAPALPIYLGCPLVEVS